MSLTLPTRLGLRSLWLTVALVPALGGGLPVEADGQAPEWASDPVQLAHACEPTPSGKELASELGDNTETPPGIRTAEAQLRALLDSDPENPIITLSLARCVLAHSGYSAAGPGIARASSLIEARTRQAAPQVEPPTRRSGPSPQYPERAWRAGVFGVVAVETTVDRNGRVLTTRIVESRPGLDDEAARTVRRWRFNVPPDGQRAAAPFVVFLKFGLVVPSTVADLIDVARVSIKTHDWARAHRAAREAQTLNARMAAAETVAAALKQHTGEFVAPQVVTMAKPSYTRDAFFEKREGSVAMKALIRTDGTTQVLHITRGLDRGLDQAAVTAVERSRFVPATQNGVNVEMLADFVMNFSLTEAP